jgi:hypothetical protein
MAKASTGDSEFDRDTAVVLRAPGVHDANLSAGWTIAGALNGGYLLATLARALADTLPHPHPVSVSGYYLTPPTPGPAEIRTETVRAGRTLSTGQASLVQYAADGSAVERIRVLASYGDLGAQADSVRTSAVPPVVPPWERCVGREDAPATATTGFDALDRYGMKVDPATAGWAVGAPSGKGEVRGWFALLDGREPDPLALLLAVDALPPTAYELGFAGWTPTVELTVHVRALPAPGRLRVVKVTRNLAGGFLEEDAEVWDTKDRLVAQSRQLQRAPRG